MRNNLKNKKQLVGKSDTIEQGIENDKLSKMIDITDIKALKEFGVKNILDLSNLDDQYPKVIAFEYEDGEFSIHFDKGEIPKGKYSNPSVMMYIEDGKGGFDILLNVSDYLEKENKYFGQEKVFLNDTFLGKGTTAYAECAIILSAGGFYSGVNVFEYAKTTYDSKGNTVYTYDNKALKETQNNIEEEHDDESAEEMYKEFLKLLQTDKDGNKFFQLKEELYIHGKKINEGYTFSGISHDYRYDTFLEKEGNIYYTQKVINEKGDLNIKLFRNEKLLVENIPQYIFNLKDEDDENIYQLNNRNHYNFIIPTGMSMDKEGNPLHSYQLFDMKTGELKQSFEFKKKVKDISEDSLGNYIIFFGDNKEWEISQKTILNGEEIDKKYNHVNTPINDYYIPYTTGNFHEVHKELSKGLMLCYCSEDRVRGYFSDNHNNVLDIYKNGELIITTEKRDNNIYTIDRVGKNTDYYLLGKNKNGKFFVFKNFEEFQEIPNIKDLNDIKNIEWDNENKSIRINYNEDKMRNSNIDLELE